ncbi:MAG TPA: cytochrome c [Steroidobacteraceae bacterium]|nr:cytochrome c [Steroidobacteraceae bacterium]
MKSRLALWALLCLSAGACGADQLTPAQAKGKQAYDHICIYCHSPGVWGTNRLARRMDKDHAVLENRTDLTAAGIRAVVRAGIGSMPPLRRTELSDADVDAIAAYLTRPRSLEQ